jgi:hypothetical protein
VVSSSLLSERGEAVCKMGGCRISGTVLTVCIVSTDYLLGTIVLVHPYFFGRNAIRDPELETHDPAGVFRTRQSSVIIFWREKIEQRNRNQNCSNAGCRSALYS